MNDDQIRDNCYIYLFNRVAVPAFFDELVKCGVFVPDDPDYHQFLLDFGYKALKEIGSVAQVKSAAEQVDPSQVESDASQVLQDPTVREAARLLIGSAFANQQQS